MFVYITIKHMWLVNTLWQQPPRGSLCRLHSSPPDPDISSAPHATVRPCNYHKWKSNVIKQNRNKGLEYVSCTSGKIVYQFIKKGNKFDITNYRAVCSLYQFSKKF